MRRFKSDQLVIPISLPEGLAIRQLATDINISIATLARQLLVLGVEHLDEKNKVLYAKHLAEFTNMNDIELLNLKPPKPNQRNSYANHITRKL